MQEGPPSKQADNQADNLAGSSWTAPVCHLDRTLGRRPEVESLVLESPVGLPLESPRKPAAAAPGVAPGPAQAQQQSRVVVDDCQVDLEEKSAVADRLAAVVCAGFLQAAMETRNWLEPTEVLEDALVILDVAEVAEEADQRTKVGVAYRILERAVEVDQKTEVDVGVAQKVAVAVVVAVLVLVVAVAVQRISLLAVAVATYQRTVETAAVPAARAAEAAGPSAQTAAAVAPSAEAAEEGEEQP
mmetsp:Transcript_2275/g.3915  ORF Transcript_2275/g.3915 Transcript_2275/m.3915 type:complete len:244 (-) Transcript_2275:2-733(-)